MKDYSFLSTMTYEALWDYVTTCLLACDYESADKVFAELESRYPERYYDEYYNYFS